MVVCGIQSGVASFHVEKSLNSQDSYVS